MSSPTYLSTNEQVRGSVGVPMQFLAPIYRGRTGVWTHSVAGRWIAKVGNCQAYGCTGVPTPVYGTFPAVHQADFTAVR